MPQKNGTVGCSAELVAGTGAANPNESITSDTRGDQASAGQPITTTGQATTGQATTGQTTTGQTTTGLTTTGQTTTGQTTTGLTTTAGQTTGLPTRNGVDELGLVNTATRNTIPTIAVTIVTVTQTITTLVTATRTQE
jgi:hypothetical protein